MCTNIEYHKGKTAISADLLKNNSRLVIINDHLIFVLYCINYIRYHNDRHYGKSVIIKPIHIEIISKTSMNFKQTT